RPDPVAGVPAEAPAPADAELVDDAGRPEDARAAGEAVLLTLADEGAARIAGVALAEHRPLALERVGLGGAVLGSGSVPVGPVDGRPRSRELARREDRKSTRLNS